VRLVAAINEVTVEVMAEADGMSLRDEFMRRHSDFPFLRAGDRDGVEDFLRQQGWIDAGETISSCEPAGPGNMNLTLHVRTSQRDVVLKQARPWVEKYDHIEAPWSRAEVEIRFYRRVAGIPAVAGGMPALLAADPASSSLLLEYLPGAGDFSDLYDPDLSAGLSDSDLDRAAFFLARLHEETRGRPDSELANREMRDLNRAHVFEIPLAQSNGLELDVHEPGLAKAAHSLQIDRAYRSAVSDIERVYLADGPCLLHGDYFPGSWLRAEGGLRVIDPEFGFFGRPEIDLGCTLAHFALARQSVDRSQDFLGRYARHADGPDPDPKLLAGFAAVEVMRRLIGVAQLPIPSAGKDGPALSEGPARFRAALLQRSREAICQGEWSRLWDQ